MRDTATMPASINVHPQANKNFLSGELSNILAQTKPPKDEEATTKPLNKDCCGVELSNPLDKIKITRMSMIVDSENVQEEGLFLWTAITAMARLMAHSNPVKRFALSPGIRTM